MTIFTSLIFENEAGRLLDSGDGYVRLTWHGGVVKSEFRHSILEKLLEFVGARGNGLALIDQRLMMPLSPAEQQWMNHDWAPRAARAGYRVRAVIQANDAFARLATSSMLGLQTQLIKHQFFTDEAMAITWLKAQ